MAAPAITTNAHVPSALADSKDSETETDTDYGSDFSPEEERIVERLLAGKPDIEDNPIASRFEQNDAQQILRVPRIFGREQRSPLYEAANAAYTNKNAQYPDLRSRPAELDHDPPLEPVREPKHPDTRSPLLRFRTEPKKALSVTDLVSPAWCQLQYWYTLTLHGRKKRTPEMKQGSVVHQKLEEQVYTTVKVDIESKEDSWGLRIWNVIQGLRILRETGQTRELEIWGVMDGLVVNGVIDELSYICPNEELEPCLEDNPIQNRIPPNQPSVTHFFGSGNSGSIRSNNKRHNFGKKVYICDVKTRGVKSLPTETAFRPTKMQLMLYHSMLGSMATNKIDFGIITTRYKLDAEKMFSDSFIAQVGSLNDNDSYDAPEASQESGQWSQDSMATLLAHNSISALWSLMISEFQITLPDGTASLGDVLVAEYRSRDKGEILGCKTFPMDVIGLQAYVQREIEWWRGEREAQGVVVEEAFKCRSCDFSDDCEWRLKKVEEAKEKVRMSRKRTGAI